MNLKDQRAAVLKAAQGIVEAAKSAGRDLTDSENASIKEHMTEIKGLDVQIKAAADSSALFASVANLGGPPSDDGLGPSELFNDGQKEGFLRAARTKGSYSTTVHFKAPVLGTGVGLPAVGNGVVQAVAPTAAVALRELFTQAEAPGPTVRYYRMSTASAAVVAEGAVKPDAGMTATPVDAALIKLATTFKVSDELAEDAPYLISALQQGAMRSILVTENAEIVTRLGAASGILVASGTAATALDVIAGAIGSAEAFNGVTPGALVVNPVDLANMRKLKATTAGSYFIDPLSSAPSAVHGVPVLSTVNATAGTAYLVTSGVGVFYTRGGLRVDSGYSGDDWQRNLQTVRVEERVLPAITQPSYITKITLT